MISKHNASNLAAIAVAMLLLAVAFAPFVVEFDLNEFSHSACVRWFTQHERIGNLSMQVTFPSHLFLSSFVGVRIDVRWVGEMVCEQKIKDVALPGPWVSRTYASGSRQTLGRILVFCTDPDRTVEECFNDFGIPNAEGVL